MYAEACAAFGGASGKATNFMKMAIPSLENKLSMVKKSTLIIKVFKSKVTLVEKLIVILI